MKIHGNTVTDADLYVAAVKAGVDLQRQTRHGSKIRNRSYDVALSGSSNRWANSGSYGRAEFKAATWAEWGHFLGYLFSVDPSLTVPRVYADANDFHRKTNGQFYQPRLGVNNTGLTLAEYLNVETRRGEAYRNHIERHFMVGTSHGWPAAPPFDYDRLAGPPESPIAWRLTRPNHKGYGHKGYGGLTN